MSATSFAGYLARLDEAELIGVLNARPDARTEPVPRGFPQLAQRLSGPESLGTALVTANRDMVIAGQAVAVLGDAATVPAIADLLDADEQIVCECVDRLRAIGLAWLDDARVRLPERLHDHWRAELGIGRPVAVLARPVYADDLRATAEALGVDTARLRKPEVISALSTAMSDTKALARIVTGLAGPERRLLDTLRGQGIPGRMFGGYRTDPAIDRLLSIGLVIKVNHQPEMPAETAMAVWLAGLDRPLTGPPRLPAPRLDADAVRGAAQAAAQEALRMVTTVLDEAARASIARLKRGGVGQRERVRLAKRLSVSVDAVTLWIDLASAAELLGETEAGYAPTPAYADWRAAEPARQWTTIARAWLAMEHAPTNREIEDGKEIPPPLPIGSAAGIVRRALLTASAGATVSAAAAEIDWFCPFHDYDADGRAKTVAACVREAELLGIMTADRLTELGEHVLAADAGELTELCAPLLPDTPCRVLLQSDLTAVVSGRTSARVARLLAVAAVNEGRGSAEVWRFGPASVRAALDAGWEADQLLAELAEISASQVPQPLDYLVNDVARRHGQVRVRGARSCLRADATLIKEILADRSLRSLRLSAIAPTVLCGPFDLDTVLSRLRDAGLSPVAEDDSGEKIVEGSDEHQAPDAQQVVFAAPSRLDAPELARMLMADPDGAAAAEQTETFMLLTQLNHHLDEAEVTMLAEAVDHKTHVRISYRDKNGSRSIRTIQPQSIYGRWLDSWCHLRNGQRDFTIGSIESVAPAG
ncbi:XPB/Ssl2-like helicase family protein [Herbihabitans rhizosphaerae]|uniref:XPB/Ssl2-like helicase family protein n=1 Tax=Herbihabitans rhizosphaerae TaxID=1872711 RepID=A0A4Q7KML8_9PSEU|nr:helicase-associated domain-containing protein [Herbihabitans rhizosphaerae]RZS37564.1 XPB/Ssl2-like helicase family protein [Herbihabitans rhizosphaerae]